MPSGGMKRRNRFRYGATVWSRNSRSRAVTVLYGMIGSIITM